MEFFRFTVISVIGLFLDLLVSYSIVAALGASLFVASIWGFSFGALFCYLVHNLWTFRCGENRAPIKKVSKYILSLIIILFTRLTILNWLSITVEQPGNELLFLCTAVIVSFITNFLFMKYFVFHRDIYQNNTRLPETVIQNQYCFLQKKENLSFDANWQVPSYEIKSLSEKINSYALVIPVINEGLKIRKQLQNIQDTKLAIDVIVADGGSTDGSLDLEFLNLVGVRSLLTKTGPGGLSAQLRVAYSWCLLQSYKGIITIDGNGKDGVAAISKFIEKLEEGFDYVQGSRYLSEGKALNTPIDRVFGNRIVHSPLMSISGNYHFTDTTNGFRGYSAKYLMDNEVLPFRDLFIDYELLFYLTVRAGQLGYRVCEVPVTRNYPARGATPTKIVGLKARVKILKQTFLVAIGLYNPVS